MGWHVIRPYMPHVVLSLVHTHAMWSCPYSMDATCHPVSGATWHLFLPIFPVDLIEQNAITFSYGVRLRWNERRWNRLDEPFDLALVLLRLEDFENLTFLDPPGSLMVVTVLLYWLLMTDEMLDDCYSIAILIVDDWWVAWWLLQYYYTVSCWWLLITERLDDWCSISILLTVDDWYHAWWLFDCQ